MTAATEQRVREAATALHDAITEARSEGLAVTWPRTLDDLPAIAISETAKAVATPNGLPITSDGTDTDATVFLGGGALVDVAGDTGKPKAK